MFGKNEKTTYSYQIDIRTHVLGKIFKLVSCQNIDLIIEKDRHQEGVVKRKLYMQIRARRELSGILCDGFGEGRSVYE